MRSGDKQKEIRSKWSMRRRTALCQWHMRYNSESSKNIPTLRLASFITKLLLFAGGKNRSCSFCICSVAVYIFLNLSRFSVCLFKRVEVLIFFLGRGWRRVHRKIRSYPAKCATQTKTVPFFFNLEFCLLPVPFLICTAFLNHKLILQ